MGRRDKRKLNFGHALVAFVFLQNICFSQTMITGSVKDSTNNLYSVSVILKDSLSRSIVAYTYSDDTGKFEIKTKGYGKFNLVFASLGYELKTIPLVISPEQAEFNIDVVLKYKPMDLDEVIIKADLPISIKKDTISIDARSFAQGNEKVVEDLLRKIPGLNIDGEGTIKIGGQEVEKVMVEGDDFFERGYKVLTKNMPPHPIDKVEIVQNHSNNRLLKGVEESDKVALNLTLKEGAKRVWFGNGKAGNDLTFSNRYELQANLMNFGKGNKHYLITNLNNVGHDATGDIDHLIRPYRYNEPASVGDGQSVDQFVQLNASPLNFKQIRTTFNNAELLSLNAIFNPMDNLKIKTLAFLNFDENQYFRNRADNVDVNGTNFTNSEEYRLGKSKSVLFGKTDIMYDLSKDQMFEATTKYNFDKGRGNGNLVFNDSPTMEDLDSRNKMFDQKLTYTNRIKKKTTLMLTARYIDERIDQNYKIDNYFFQDLFSAPDNVDNVNQSVKNNMKFAGIEAHMLHRNTKNNLLALKFGNTYRRDRLTSVLSLLENQTVVNEPIGFKNDFDYRTNDIYVEGKYRYEMNGFALIGKVAFHQLFNQMESLNTKNTQSPSFFNPSLGLDWKINDENEIKASYVFNTTNLELMDIYDSFVLQDFRNFGQGTKDFDQLRASSAMVNHRFGNWSDRFFASTFLVFSKNHDFLSTNSLITPNYALSENIVIKDRKSLNMVTNLDYYFKKLSSNLKAELGYNQSDFKNVVNNSSLRKVKNTNYRYGAEFRSAFNGFFNFNVGSKWTVNEITTTKSISFTDNFSFTDLAFVFNEKWDAQLQIERYYFGNLQTDHAYYFMDLEIRYQLKRNKLSFELSGKNLLDTKTFRNFSISDIGTTTTEHRLLPRFALLKIEYRF